MINTDKLKGKIVESRYTYSAISKEIGINRATFYRKINQKHGDTFTVKEAVIMAKVLNLSKDDALSIFFAPLVSDMR